MNTREWLTRDQVAALLEYDQQKGEFRWKPRPPEMFKVRACDCRIWNRKNAGKIAGSITNKGYLRIKIFGVAYLCHRLAWLLMTGSWPAQEIDHINGIKTDNRFANLRHADRVINLGNMAIYKNNATGVHGVRWNPKKLKWEAYIQRDGASTFLGTHADLLSAACARKSAELRLGFHANHGQRAAA
jgi:predicted Rdx family selenoprotein